MVLRVARWWLTLLGGVLLGMGLVLHGQVMWTRYIRNEVENTFILWRGIGKLTFVFQDTATKTALTAHEFPASLINEADRAAWTLVAIGVILAATAFLISRPGRARQSGHRFFQPAPS
jgi:hypothetical protein